MSVSASGSSAAPTIYLYAGNEDTTPPAGGYVLRLGSLEPAELTEWKRLLEKNPELIADLASALAVTIQTVTSGALTSGEFATTAFTRGAETTGVAPEPAPKQRKGSKTNKRRSGISKRARRPSTVNDAGSSAPPSLRQTWLSMVTSSQTTRHQITGESQKTVAQSPSGIGNQFPDECAKSLIEQHGPDFEQEQKGKSDQIANTTKCVYGESVQFSNEAHTNRPGLEYTRTPQHKSQEHACPHLGHSAARTAQPEGRDKVTPFPCGTCGQCIDFKKLERSNQYRSSGPLPLLTMLTCAFPTIGAADRFAKLPAHRTRIPGIRKHVGLWQPDEWVFDDRCLVRILWDAEATEKQQRTIKRHANKSGATNVDLDIRPVSELVFRDWLPDRFTIPLPDGTRINASRFSNGWAQEMKLPNDWRGGLTRTFAGKPGKQLISIAMLTERAKATKDSWVAWYKYSRDSSLRSELRWKAEQEAQTRLERARYVNIMDWLHRWEVLQPFHLDTTREFIESYLCRENPDVRDWQHTTQGPKALAVEVARWLNGEREPEPAILLAAERLGFITPLQPYIDVKFLLELINTLPPFELQKSP